MTAISQFFTEFRLSGWQGRECTQHILPAEDLCNPPVSRGRVDAALSFYFNYRWSWFGVAGDFRALSLSDSMAIRWNTSYSVTTNILNYFPGCLLILQFSLPFQWKHGMALLFHPLFSHSFFTAQVSSMFLLEMSEIYFSIVSLWLSLLVISVDFPLLTHKTIDCQVMKEKKYFSPHSNLKLMVTTPEQIVLWQETELPS